MSTSFTNHGVANFASASTTTAATSHTIDINNSSGTTAGDAGFTVVTGSYNFNPETTAEARVQFLNSSSSTLNLYYTMVSTFTTNYATSGQSTSSYAQLNYWTQHGSNNAETDFNAERVSFMYHLSSMPATSSTHSTGSFYFSGTYYYNEYNAAVVVSYVDGMVYQNNTDNKVDKMVFTANTGNLDNFKCKVFRLGAR